MMTTQWKQSKGLTIIYVGDGKGKTTAAVGAAVRALGHGWDIFFMQFMKEEKWPSGERDFFRALDSRTQPHPSSLRSSPLRGDSLLSSSALPSLAEAMPASSSTPLGGIAADRGETPLQGTGKIRVEVVGEGFVGIMGDKKERETHRTAAQAGYEKAVAALSAGKYQLVVLDEILSAVDEGLLTEQQILDLMTKKPEDVTLIMTGHKSYSAIFAKADLVTEMKKVKHPFDVGFIAKRGVDY
ncbi:cob(I)yrinic acid a,c-diamide adenosyltransferase [Candidatus Uhrbacteria bacterium]|nr:cob(I)yrinic acid a,c-diamide adenosyltransferase [Candidatus Uhrbacteria bacterium]